MFKPNVYFPLNIKRDKANNNLLTSSFKNDSINLIDWLGIDLKNGDNTKFLSQKGTYETISSSNGWNLTGNSGTDPNLNFIGTIDNKNIVFKRNNTFSGFISGRSVSLGVNSLANGTSTQFNAAFGYLALSNNISGDYNTGIGSQAGTTISDGTYNTCIGFSADTATSSTVNAIALGNEAIASDNQFAIPDTVTTIKFKGIVYTLPTSLPVVSGVLTCDSSGNLSWS